MSKLLPDKDKIEKVYPGRSMKLIEYVKRYRKPPL